MSQASVLKEFREEDLMDVALVRTSVDACLRGHLARTARRVAVKLLGCSTAEGCDRLAQVKNALTLGRVCSERILVPLGLFKAPSLFGLVWDWMAEGSLHSLLYETHVYPDLPMAPRLQVLLDVAEGLNHLHAIPLPHGALKATNVLLDQQYRAKLCDWGQQTCLDLRAPTSHSGSPCFRDLAYMSPEVIQGGAPSIKADMYSFGVLIWEALNRRQPCEVTDHLQTLLLSAQEGVETGVEVKLLPLETPQCHVLTRLVIRCLSSEPNRRPLAEECVVELRKAVATLGSDAGTTAARRLKECKERAMLCCKNPTAWALPVELNNLEGYSGGMRRKNLTSKTIPVNGPCLSKAAPRIPKSDETSPRGTLPVPATARASPPAGCCKGTANNPVLSKGTSSITCNSPGFRWCGVLCDVSQTRTPTPPNTPCGSPTAAIQASLQRPSLASQVYHGSAGWSCCRLLQEKREAIVHCMTEGRLNNLLDVLRARQAVTREAYELITAALTLTARTRCLLDICSCLGENVALLVASTLGLVSREATHSYSRTQMASKGQAG
ncbi:receptor-interacting serine/threonine-protein kinase 2 [Colossoma macropomum]|uniref:receptor-interacting serine/threonine-protein kinase 2 n=1 Tax=Colossoma macropomum TaxID=42526 RepID=UPI001865022F|nr:receptor-interacting serine/threonine-protein kinase 2 [Colossoma macropomum]